MNLDNMSRVVSNRSSACSSTLASATWEAAQAAEHRGHLRLVAGRWRRKEETTLDGHRLDASMRVD